MFKRVFVVLFVVIISIPAFQMFTGFFPENKLTENRNKNDCPTLEWQGIKTGDFMRQTDACLNDNFGFRDWLISKNNDIDVKILNHISNPDVIRGKEDYLFYQQELDDYNRLATVTDNELDNFIAGLNNIQRGLEKEGIYFLFIVGLNKSTIYPEFMLSNSKNQNDPSNYERLVGKLEQKGINYLDLSTVLRANKQQYDLYYKRDTHWNETAGFLATREILKKIAPVVGIQYAPQIQSFEESYGGAWDLNIMLGISKPIMYKTEYKLPIIDYGPITKKLPPMLWYHDSFGTAIEAHLSHYISSLTYLHYGEHPVANTLKTSMKDQKIVIYQVVERALPIIVKQNLEIFEEDLDTLTAKYTRKELPLNAITLSYDVDLLFENDNLNVTTLDIDPWMIWNLSEEERAKYIIVELSKPPVDSTGQIFWTTKSDPVYDEVKSKVFTLMPSKQVYAIPVNSSDPIQAIRLDLGQSGGLQYSLKAVSYLVD